jgi:sulfofructose kinase
VSCGDGADGARPRTILCAGVAVLDQVFRLDHFPVPQEKARASALAIVGGGCAANAAVAAARLGARVRLAAPLGGPAGEDMIGDRILIGLAREGIDCAGTMRVDGVPSPISAILVDGRGERIIVNFRDERLGAARPPDAGGVLAGADAVLADNRFPEFVLPICAAARERHIPVVLDADRPTRAADALIDIATHVVFSAEGLRGAGSHDDLAVALARVGQRASAFLAVTDGANGVIWRNGAALDRLPAFAVDTIDTLGAGDVFHGAFALALAEGRPEPAALRFAAAAAAVKCTRFGGIAGAPGRGEVAALLGRQKSA